MLGLKELQSLMNLIEEDEKPLEIICTQIHKNFNKPDLFKLGCSLYILLKVLSFFFSFFLKIKFFLKSIIY